MLANAPQIADLAARNRLPTIGFREIADAGGLIAYAVSFPAAWRRAADFVDKIFKGAKPGDLPIEQATKFEEIVSGLFNVPMRETRLTRAALTVHRRTGSLAARWRDVSQEPSGGGRDEKRPLIARAFRDSTRSGSKWRRPRRLE